MENKYLPIIGKVYFMAIAVLMYYFLTEYIDLGLYVTYRHAFALVLFASAFLAFLYKPNIARGLSTIKPTAVYCSPLLIIILFSLFIWFIKQVDIDVINRGLSSVFIYTNMLSATLASAAFLYVFGEKGIWYNLIAILISNILMILTIIAQNGIGQFFSEFITLIITFADVTGSVIVQAEIHELAFCLGAYIIYMFLKPQKNILFFILLALSLFCFLAAFKRIGIVAIIAALIFGIVLKWIAKYKRDTAMFLTVFLTVLMVLILIGYIFVIKMDIFTMLEKLGIETSGRALVYKAVDHFYEFSPNYLGKGYGFLTYQLNTNINVDVSAVHNDFLQYFIDLGFWGYIFWLAAITLVRICYFGAKGKTENAILTFALTVYLVIVSSTDNTMSYPLLTTVLGILMIGHTFDENVRTTEMKLFGSISDTNKHTEDQSIL